MQWITDTVKTILSLMRETTVFYFLLFQSRPSYSQNQQLSSGQSISGVHHESLAYQKMQQQQYQMHQMQQGRPGHKLMVAPSGTSPVQPMSMVQSNHTASGLAPPQLLFGDCSR